MRSRNCRPRLVYFLAMEITRRRFASTISFLARRALASPIDTSRLTSLMSLMLRWYWPSSCSSFFCRRSISSLNLASIAEYFLPPLTCLPSQRGLVSFLGKEAMKSLRGMPASRTAMTMISFSSWRTSATCVRRLRISASNMRREAQLHELVGELLALAQRLRVARAELGDRAEYLHVQLGERGEARGCLDRIGSGVERFLFLAVAVLLVLVVIVQLLFGGNHFHLGGVLRLRNDIRGVRVDEADDHVDEAALTGLHRLIGPQQEVVGWRVHGECAAHRVQSLLDALGDADLALAREELDGAHLAHVHAHRIGGTPQLGVERGERRGGLFDRLLVRRRGRLGGEQRLGIRCLLVHRNAHVVNGVDDVFDLLRIDDLGGQVIVHLCVGEIALLLAARNQQLQLRLAVLGHHRYAPLDAERALVGIQSAAGRLRVRPARAVVYLGISTRNALARARRRLARKQSGVLAAILLAQPLHCGDRLFGGSRLHGSAVLWDRSLLVRVLWLVLACHVSGGGYGLVSPMCCPEGDCSRGSKAKRAILFDSG